MTTLETSDLAAPRVARPAPMSTALLTDIAAGLAAHVELWRPHAHHRSAERQPVRLVACDLWEAWVVGWTAGQQVEMHDHGDAAGVVVVVEGDLVEVLSVGAHRLPRELREGAVVELPVGVVHDVVGLSPQATSIHVYSPPLAAMTFYDDHGRKARVDALADEPVITDLRSVSRALHPSATRTPPP